ncbi:MAG: hypothetical protein ACR2RF_26090 [Geminicoccaceae bacterium]
MTATLQTLLDNGIGLYYRCRCGHSDVLDGKTLAAVLGNIFPIEYVHHCIMCPKCGHKNVEVQPDWPSKGPGVIVKAVP